MGEDVKISYGVNLLVYLLNGTILLCIIGYQILLVSDIYLSHTSIAKGYISF